MKESSELLMFGFLAGIMCNTNKIESFQIMWLILSISYFLLSIIFQIKKLFKRNEENIDEK